MVKMEDERKKIDRARRVLRWSLLGGAVYFLCVSTAHMLGIKEPFLFVYFNVSSHVYQDRIISLLSFGWAMFFCSGWESVKNNNLKPVKYILLAGIGGIAGLCVINLGTDFSAVSTSRGTEFFWLETAVLMAYFVWLTVWYRIAHERT